MIKQKQLVPKRRFNDFKESWKLIQLEEILNVNSGRDYKHLNKGNIPVYGTGGLMLYVDDMLSEVDGIGVGRKGTIDKPQYLKAPFWTVDTLFYMTPNQKTDLYFIYAKSQMINWRKMDESTGVPSLSKVTIEKIPFYWPEYKEQQKIGQFFKHFDEMIALQQRKIDKTKALKSAYFVEMFPAEGESVPKRRFSGFTGEWEEYSLGELTKINTGGSDAQDAKENGAYPFFVRSEKIQRSDNYTFNGEAILIPGEGRLGEIYHHFIGKFDYHQRVYKISHFDEKLDGKFTFYTMHKTFKKHALKYTVKATVDSLRLPVITEYKLLLPTIKEQQKIGQFFKHLDEMIATHQQKLEKLKATKQAYLHEMFV